MSRRNIPGCRTLLSAIGRLRHDRGGAILVTYTLIMTGLLGTTGLAIETGLWYTVKRNLQTQADAAALSGAFERRKGNPDYADVSAAALLEAGRNGYVSTASNSIVINNPPTNGSFAGEDSAVQVTVSAQQSLLFSSLFLNGLTVSAQSVAAVETTGTACVLALDPSASGAIKNQGNPTVSMDGCVLAANSTDDQAITVSGSAIVDAKSLWTAGNISIGGSATVTLDDAPVVNAWAIDDPYAAIDIATLGTCDHNSASYTNVTTTIDPGIYCDGIDFGSNATITLNPGTYYVDRGDVNINASAYLRCSCPDPEDGVTFVLTSSTGPGNIGAMMINGGADVELRAPTGEFDEYKGILVYQDRRAPQGQSVKFNGGSSMLLTGAIYIPRQTVEWSGGNSASGSTCTQIIGRTVKFVGNSQIVNTGCETAGIEPLEIVGVRIVQ